MNNLALNTKMFDTVIGIQAMDNSCIDKGREIFEQYKEKHVIIDNSFPTYVGSFLMNIPMSEYSSTSMKYPTTAIIKPFLICLFLSSLTMSRHM